MFGGRSFPSAYETILGFIYPENCRQCDVRIDLSEARFRKKELKNTLFCTDCWEEVIPLSSLACPVCAAPYKSPAALSHSPSHLCGDCREDLPSFSRAITPYPYEGPLAKAIQLLKYKKQTGLAKNLADLLVDKLAQLRIDLVLAIPIHYSKLRRREFNQSLLLANAISKRLKWPLKVDVIFRNRETNPQVSLSKKDRKKNVHRIFSIRHPEFISGRRILLVDDVYTTGATLKEGAKSLIKAGAKEVVVTAPTRMILGS